MEEKVKKIILGLCTRDSLDNGDRLKEDLSMDSLSMVVLLIRIEDEMAIVLEESDMNPFELKNVGDVVAMVGKYGDRK